MTLLGADFVSLAPEDLILDTPTARHTRTPLPPPGGLSGRPYGEGGGVVNAAR
jgi:hypothetical protein